MINLLSYIPGRKRRSGSGWTVFNAVCCHHRGHNPDRRMRGGIIEDGHDQVYHCFNCDFKCKFILGKVLTKPTKQLLEWCGVDETHIAKLSIESLQYKDMMDLIAPVKPIITVSFKETQLPEGEMLDATNPVHKPYIDYLISRRIDYQEYPFLITPNDDGRYANRIVIPFTFKGKIVGNTSRFLDDRTPKYLNDQQHGYLFGYDFQRPEWTTCIVTEGIFDALSIDGCALGTNTVSKEQASLLSRLNRRIVVVPDMDKSGMELCEQALELGYYVSLPEWGVNSKNKLIKDTNEAVIKFGKLPVLLSILRTATNSKIKIDMRRKKIAKRI